MIRLPNDITQRDVEQWLYNCWFLGEYEGSVQPMLFVEANGSKVLGELDAKIVAIPLDKVGAWWPVVGAVNVFDNEGTLTGAIFIERVQTRQYKRSLEFEQLRISVPREYDMKRCDPKYRRMMPHAWIAKSLYDRKFFSFREAIQKIDRKEAYRVAINPHMILVGNRGKILLYYHEFAVGRINHLSDVELTALGRARKARIKKLLKGEANVA